MDWLDELRTTDAEAAEIIDYWNALEAIGAREWREANGSDRRALVSWAELQRLGRQRLKRLRIT